MMAMSGSDPSSSERRQVTILHCDIVDSTYIIEHADPEDFQELIHEFVKICESAVNGVSGHMAGFTGDGIEAYFGHPVASENAPVDALLAAIAIQEQVGGIPVPIAEEHTLRVRIGVATGLVVTEVPTGPVAGKEVLAYGTPAHLAARLEAAAGPGESYVDSTTRNLTAPEFVFEEIGSVRFKGIEADQVVWRLIRHNPSVTRFRSESRP